jgi:hypothetical protein
LAEALDAERFALPEAPDVERSVAPDTWVVVRFVHATGTMAGQLARQKVAYSARVVRFPDATGSTRANSAVERTFSSSGFRAGGSNWPAYCSYYCSSYCSSGDSHSEADPMFCSGWANSPGDKQDSILVTRSDFHLDGSPLDFPKDDFAPDDFRTGPRLALAWATSPVHGKCLQQPWRKLRHVL